MILDCAWSPSGGVFATAGRDKSVKVWRVTAEDVELVKTMPVEAPVTALAFAPGAGERVQMAYGTEQGRIGIVSVDGDGDGWKGARVEAVRAELGPARAVTSLRWRPCRKDDGKSEQGRELAVASEDGGLRLLRVM